jgi:Flp pilus assembly protein TadB
MQKHGRFIGISLVIGIVLAMYLVKKIIYGLLIASIIIGVAFLIGLFLEYNKFKRNK